MFGIILKKSSTVANLSNGQFCLILLTSCDACALLYTTGGAECWGATLALGKIGNVLVATPVARVTEGNPGCGAPGAVSIRLGITPGCCCCCCCGCICWIWNRCLQSVSWLAQLAERRTAEWEVVGLNPGQTNTQGLKNNWEKSCLCNDSCKHLDFLVFSDKHEKQQVPSHCTFTYLVLVGRKRTHATVWKG